MTECNEILHAIPFRPEEGHRIVFDRKFLLQRGVFLTIVRFTTVNPFFGEVVRRMILLGLFIDHLITEGANGSHHIGHVTEHVITHVTTYVITHVIQQVTTHRIQHVTTDLHFMISFLDCALFLQRWREG